MAGFDATGHRLRPQAWAYASGLGLCLGAMFCPMGILKGYVLRRASAGLLLLAIGLFCMAFVAVNDALIRSALRQSTAVDEPSTLVWERIVKQIRERAMLARRRPAGYGAAAVRWGARPYLYITIAESMLLGRQDI